MLQEEAPYVAPAFPDLGPGQGPRAPACKSRPRNWRNVATAQVPGATQLCGQPPREVVGMVKGEEVMVTNVPGKRREAVMALSSARLAL